MDQCFSYRWQAPRFLLLCRCAASKYVTRWCKLIILDTKRLPGQLYELCSNEYDRSALENAVTNWRDSSCRIITKFVDSHLSSSRIVLINVRIKMCKSRPRISTTEATTIIIYDNWAEGRNWQKNTEMQRPSYWSVSACGIQKWSSDLQSQGCYLKLKIISGYLEDIPVKHPRADFRFTSWGRY